MINEEKVKIMDRLALYEKQEGRKYLPVSKYYRSDYIGYGKKQKITEHLIKKWIDTESGTREETLRISAFAGAIYNMYREWSKGDFLELPEDVAAILYDLRKQTV